MVLGLTSFDRVTLKDILASRVGMNVIRPTQQVRTLLLAAYAQFMLMRSQHQLLLNS